MRQVEWAACGSGPCENRHELAGLRSKLAAAEAVIEAARGLLTAGKVRGWLNQIAESLAAYDRALSTEGDE